MVNCYKTIESDGMEYEFEAYEVQIIFKIITKNSLSRQGSLSEDSSVAAYHEKIQLFVLWMINSSSFIHIEEPGWRVIFLYFDLIS
jgi:hypothetical protein